MSQITADNIRNWGYMRRAFSIQRIGVDNAFTNLQNANNVKISIVNNIEPNDGLDEDNNGYTIRPQRYEIEFEVPLNTPMYRLVRDCAKEQYQFNLKIREHKDDRVNPQYSGIREYQGIEEMLSGCMVSNFEEGFVIGERSYARCRGFALRYGSRDTETGEYTWTGGNNYALQSDRPKTLEELDINT